MAKVTSKLQVTIPKAIAVAELDFESAGDVIRVRRRRKPAVTSNRAQLAAFDQGTKRQADRDRQRRRQHPAFFKNVERGWRREDLYDRGLPR
jgi:hypothetical protein